MFVTRDKLSIRYLVDEVNMNSSVLGKNYLYPDRLQYDIKHHNRNITTASSYPHIETRLPLWIQVVNGIDSYVVIFKEIAM